MTLTILATIFTLLWKIQVPGTKILDQRKKTTINMAQERASVFPSQPSRVMQLVCVSLCAGFTVHQKGKRYQVIYPSVHKHFPPIWTRRVSQGLVPCSIQICTQHTHEHAHTHPAFAQMQKCVSQQTYNTLKIFYGHESIFVRVLLKMLQRADRYAIHKILAHYSKKGQVSMR